MSLVFSKEPLYDERHARQNSLYRTTNLRDYYFTKFKRHISLLVEQKKNRRVSSNKGLLNSRALHKYQFSDNIFTKNIRNISSDTTILFLIDGSGSMTSSEDTPIGNVSRIGICTAVASAFAKANLVVLKNKIPIEVFVKSAPPSHDSDLTGTNNGGMTILSRVFSSHDSKNDFDTMLKVGCNSPIMSEEGCYDGSYTSEFAVLPALQQWIKKNVRTKKCIVFNLTDGEAYCTLGKDGHMFRSEDNKAMRIKYLRGMPNLTLMMGCGDISRMKDIYGDNMICTDTDFTGELFKAFAGFLD